MDKDFPRPEKPVVFVGMPASGKSRIGHAVADRLGLECRDSDHEIEQAAGMSISGIFAKFGEPEFRKRERAMIARLLAQGVCVLSIGGGAFMDADTRKLIGEKAVSICLRVKTEILAARAARRNHRPLLNQPGKSLEGFLQELAARRMPIYENETDIVVDCDDRPVEQTVDNVMHALGVYLRTHAKTEAPVP